MHITEQSTYMGLLALKQLEYRVKQLFIVALLNIAVYWSEPKYIVFFSVFELKLKKVPEI